mmetsp:Transcript_32656/g.77965  ORF Transcript_32656/g.77965 Transcript_32656/m.77965 type:complete len:714 (+) Transcript_32656:298-2439(+)
MTSRQEEQIRNLQLECGYLSIALTKLRVNSPEYSYLEKKLAAAEEELEAMVQDAELLGSSEANNSQPSSDGHQSVPVEDDLADEEFNRSTGMNGHDDTNHHVAPSIGYSSPQSNNQINYISTTVHQDEESSRSSMDHDSDSSNGNKDEHHVDVAADGQIIAHGPSALPSRSVKLPITPSNSTYQANDTSNSSQRYVLTNGYEEDIRDIRNQQPSWQRRPSRSTISADSYDEYPQRYSADGLFYHKRHFRNVGIFAVTTIAAVLIFVFLLFGHNKTVNVQLGQGESQGKDLIVDDVPVLANPEKFETACASFNMHLILDQFGNETSWDLVRNTPNDDRVRALLHASHNHTRNHSRLRPEHSGHRELEEDVMSGGPYSFKKEFEHTAQGSHYEMIDFNTCLPLGVYSFTIYDTNGDGICCYYGRGEYGLFLSRGRVIRPMKAGKFRGPSETTTFQVGGGDIDHVPLVDATPVATEELGEESSVDYDVGASNTLDDMASSPTLIQPIEGNSPLTSHVNRPSTSVNSLLSLVTASGDALRRGQSKSYGILFDIETTPTSSPTTISGMDFYIDASSPVRYEIYTKEGSWQKETNAENEMYQNGFKQVSQGTATGRGASEYTKIPLRDFKDVEMKGGGSRQAFYVTMSDDILISKTYEGNGVSRHEMKTIVLSSNEELTIFYGAAVRDYPLDRADPVTDFWYNSGFLGRIWYKKSPVGS